jgi:hypothetical protein
VTGLGLFDLDSDGLHESAPVTLWKSGSSLATATISNASETIASAETRGRWLFESITPLLIDPGDYVVGVYYASDSPEDRGAVDFVDNATRIQHTLANGLTYGGYRFSSQGPYPGGGHPTDDGFFGPNLLLSSSAEIADVNRDGKVDAADYVVWRKNDGSLAGYTLWRSNFGLTAGSGSFSLATMPEPTASAMLLTGMFASFAHRARRLATSGGLVTLPEITATAHHLLAPVAQVTAAGSLCNARGL